MMYEEEPAESIYNLIPKPVQIPEKQPRYKSKFPGTIPPTNSTFGTKGTSKPGLTNLNGHFESQAEGHHQYKQSFATMGKPGNAKVPTEVLRRREKEPQLPAPQKFNRDPTFKKPGVPKRTEQPVMNIKSSKNFVTANAVENILSSAKKPEEAMDWTKKKEYGKVPKYLQKVKSEINEEYNYVRSLQEQNQPEQNEGLRLLTDEERMELIGNLKAKWDSINQMYQQSSTLALFNLDTMGKVKRKEQYEAQLAQIEKDIEKLNKKQIWVHDDQQQDDY